MTEYHTLTLGEISDEILQTVTDIVDDYFLDQPLSQVEVLDRVESCLLLKGVVLPGNMDDPVCRKIMSVARKAKKEATG